MIDAYGKEYTFESLDEVEYLPEQCLVAIERDGKKGLFDVNGNEIVPCCIESYDSFGFYDDVIIVADQLYKRNGKKIDVDFKVEGFVFNDGLIRVSKNNYYGYANKNGELVIPCEYVEATDFSEGCAFVKKNNTWMSIDVTGNTICISNVNYNRIHFICKCGRAVARLNQKDGIIDRYFNEISEIKYDRFNNGFNFGYDDSLYFFVKSSNNLVGLIDINGKEIIPCKYDNVSIYPNYYKFGIAKIIHNGKKVWINLNDGKELFMPGKYDEIYDISDGYARVKKNGKYGYISCLPNAKALNKEDIGASKLDKKYLKEKTKQEKNEAAKKAEINVGDIINFGSYNGSIIKWRVLNVIKAKGKAMLISENVLFNSVFNNSGYVKNTDYMGFFEKMGHDIFGGETIIYTNDIVWADSYIRRYLNTSFLAKAFNDEESKMIMKTKLNTTGSRENHTRGGEDTSDYVYLLSIEEAKKYQYDMNVACGRAWWLRSPGMDNETVASISSNGELVMNKYHFATLGIRPVINIKIK